MPSITSLNDTEARKTSAHIPYRLLEADANLSFGSADTENMLIQGDNLEALKALLPYYAGQVKCIYIVLRSLLGGVFRVFNEGKRRDSLALFGQLVF